MSSPPPLIGDTGELSERFGLSDAAFGDGTGLLFFTVATEDLSR